MQLSRLQFFFFDTWLTPAYLEPKTDQRMRYDDWKEKNIIITAPGLKYSIKNSSNRKQQNAVIELNSRRQHSLHLFTMRRN